MSYGGHYEKRSLIYLTAHQNLPEYDIKEGYRDLSHDVADTYKKKRLLVIMV